MLIWSVLLVAASALHAGFQLTVSLVVYPTLARAERSRFPAVHDAHTRAIVPLVGVVYFGVVVTAAGAVLSTPAPLLVWGAALAGCGAIVVTFVRAAPLHTRLGRRGPEPELLRSLLRADRVRTGLALLALVVSVASSASG